MRHARWRDGCWDSLIGLEGQKIKKYFLLDSLGCVSSLVDKDVTGLDPPTVSHRAHRFRLGGVCVCLCLNAYVLDCACV